MKRIPTLIAFVLLFTLVGVEVSRALDCVWDVSWVEVEPGVDILEEDNREEEKKSNEEEFKFNMTPDEFRHCSWLREQPFISIVTSHDLGYTFPVFEAVFPPPESRFS